MIKECSSKKKIKPVCSGPIVEKEKPSLKPKRMGSEIDEIFARTKRKRSEKDTMADKEKPAKGLASSAKSHDKLKIRKNETKDLRENPFADSIFLPRKKTSDGLAIYTEEELSFGKSDAGASFNVSIGMTIFSTDPRSSIPEPETSGDGGISEPKTSVDVNVDVDVDVDWDGDGGRE